MVHRYNFLMPAKGQPLRYFFVAMLFAAILIGNVAEVYAQCACTFTAASDGAWNSITWTKTGTCGSNTLPGTNDCVTIPNNRTVTISSGVIYIKGLNLFGGTLNISGSGVSLYIGPTAAPERISLAIDNGGTINITNYAFVSVIGNWWNGNNGNIITEGSTGGYFEVSNCVSIGSSNKQAGDVKGPNCNLNTTQILKGTLTYCIKCPSGLPDDEWDTV